MEMCYQDRGISVESIVLWAQKQINIIEPGKAIKPDSKIAEEIMTGVSSTTVDPKWKDVMIFGKIPMTNPDPSTSGCAR